MPANYQVRAAGEDDYAALMHLYAQLHADDPSVPQALGMRTFRAILTNPDLYLFLLRDDARVLATTYLNIIPNLTRGAAPYALIENVVTDASHRGCGLGKQIIAHTLHTAWERGCYKTMLLTGSSNPATHGFYRACGFAGDEKHGYIARPGALLTRPVTE